MISSLMTNPTILLLTALLLVSVKTQTVLLPDCPNGIINPSCPTGGIVINAGSANPREGATPGWSFVASPQTDNVAWQIFAANSASVIGNANCNGVTYGDLTTVGRGGNVWAVITLNAASNVTEQPLIGVFASSGCAFVYSLPNAIIGGPIYVYTTADDGSRPEVLTRIMLTNAAFVCNAALTTQVAYILIGTMEVGVGNFVVQYAGFNSASQRGCQSSFVFSFPAPISAPGQLNPVLSPVIPMVVINGGPPASQSEIDQATAIQPPVVPLIVNNGLTTANQANVVNLPVASIMPPQLPFGPAQKFGVPIGKPKALKEGPGLKIEGPKVKGKQGFLRS